MKEYYFDYAATTPIDEDTLSLYTTLLQKYYKNSQSDLESQELIDQAKLKILNLLNISSNDYEVIFTSGGTESNNLAILGKFKEVKTKKHFITSTIEHPSVYETFLELERLGHEVSYINPEKNGIINPEKVYKEIKNNTELVSIMAINNELGTIQPINEMFTQIKENYPKILTMSDFVQALGKISISLKNVDLATFSGHKIYGPKGVGLLIKKKNIIMQQIIYGSKTSIRPGTQSLADQIIFTNLFNKAIKNQKENKSIILDYQQYFLTRINKDKIKINGENSIAIVNLTLDIKAQSETIVEYLQTKKIFISTKSSCAQKLNKPSHVLEAIGLTQKEINRTIRISFSPKNTFKEIDFLIKELNYCLNKF